MPRLGKPAQNIFIADISGTILFLFSFQRIIKVIEVYFVRYLTNVLPFHNNTDASSYFRFYDYGMYALIHGKEL